MLEAMKTEPTQLEQCIGIFVHDMVTFSKSEFNET